MKKTRNRVQYLCEYTELVDPSKLKKHPKNPNKHPSNQIAVLVKIISKFGWRHPVVVSKQTGYIICGHARLQAAIKLKCLVPVDYQDYDSEADELAILMADKIIPELSEWDEELQLVNMNELKLEGISFEAEYISKETSKNISSSDQDVSDELSKLSSVEFIRNFSKRFVLFSGGKDSQALVAWMLDNGFTTDEFELIHNSVPLDYTGLLDFIEKFAIDIGVKLHIVKSDYCNKDNFRKQVMSTGLPNYAAKWCTVTWKTQPLLKFLKINGIYKSEDSVLIMGWRREEGQKDGKDINKRAFAKEILYSKSHQCHMARPIIEVKEEKVYQMIKEHKWKLFPAYKYMKRLGCVWCLGNTKQEYIELRKRNKNDWSRAIEMIALASCCDNTTPTRLIQELQKICGL